MQHSTVKLDMFTGIHTFQSVNKWCPESSVLHTVCVCLFCIIFIRYLNYVCHVHNTVLNYCTVIYILNWNKLFFISVIIVHLKPKNKKVIKDNTKIQSSVITPWNFPVFWEVGKHHLSVKEGTVKTIMTRFSESIGWHICTHER